MDVGSFGCSHCWGIQLNILVELSLVKGPIKRRMEEDVKGTTQAVSSCTGQCHVIEHNKHKSLLYNGWKTTVRMSEESCSRVWRESCLIGNFTEADVSNKSPVAHAVLNSTCRGCYKKLFESSAQYGMHWYKGHPFGHYLPFNPLRGCWGRCSHGRSFFLNYLFKPQTN